MSSPTEAPGREIGSPPPPTPPRRRRKGSSALKLVASALLGAFLVLAGGIFYLQYKPLSGGGTVVPAPVIQGSGQGAIDAPSIYKADAAGIVLIKSEISSQAAGPSGGPQRQQGTALGSGFMIDGQGRILTNDHVVSGASKTTVTLLDKKTYDAKLVGSDPSNDLAVLKIDAPADELKPLPLGDSSKLEVGQPAVAIGNPLGLSSTETQGIVSALERDIPAPNGFTIPGAIQTDAPLTNGNSGGPLIDANGEVVGINSQVAASQDGASRGGAAPASGIGFAVPINIAKDTVGQLDQSGEITRPYLGISGYGITPDMQNLFSTDKGVAVAKVASGGPAEKAGIRGGDHTVDVGGSRINTGGDVIVAVDGSPVSDMSELQKLVSKDSVGQQVTLKVLRGSQTTDVRVTLDNRPQSPTG